jgi:hypothetical protein
MKRVQLLLPVLAIAVLAGAIVYAANNDAGKENEGVLRHVVCFSFKEDATPEQIQKVVDDFAALPKKIPTIAGFECGTNNSPENMNKGFTHCFILTFKSAKDRDAYLPHPAHKEFGKSLGPIIKDVMVIDFFAK